VLVMARYPVLKSVRVLTPDMKLEPPPDPAIATMGMSLSSISFSDTPISLAKLFRMRLLRSLRNARSAIGKSSPRRT